MDEYKIIDDNVLTELNVFQPDDFGKLKRFDTDNCASLHGDHLNLPQRPRKVYSCMANDSYKEAKGRDERRMCRRKPKMKVADLRQISDLHSEYPNPFMFRVGLQSPYCDSPEFPQQTPPIE
jgi:hypothetical protein